MELQDSSKGTKRLSRRQLLKAGGVTALGFTFTTPVIQTVMAKPAFSSYSDDKKDKKSKKDK
jgi:hypothetical protein